MKAEHQSWQQIIPKIIPALLLVGCASAPPATQTIEVPVYVPCVKEVPARPAMMTRSWRWYRTGRAAGRTS
jgi:hypothetical protein